MFQAVVAPHTVISSSFPYIVNFDENDLERLNLHFNSENK